MSRANKTPGTLGAATEGNVEGQQLDATAKQPTRQQKWRKRNPRAYLAHRAVQMALGLGVLQKQPCSVCGDTKAEAHHPRYDRPFDVVWLCRAHHKAEHRAMGVRNG